MLLSSQFARWTCFFAWIVLSPVQLLQAQGYEPAEAVGQMQLAVGLEAQLVASEPMVKQPVAMEFDDRGRLWVIQYLQYPNPAELKRVQVDRFSRTKYDRIPDPPPKGPKGADRITILEDRDGDGCMDHSHDFVSGLNLASGFAFGMDGVFVLNVPYLLFYADRNRDDIPDGDPEVLLTGFGMEDAHSVANSLTWGPDGWLYGCQGSTVTANIRGIEFQQGVWRYHPVNRKFELFCEGGGNSWGLDFDQHGRLFYSTNFGGHVLLHGLQGGYYVKSFAKHGELHNPYAFGFFDHAPHTDFRGGHVTVGGIIYQGDNWPARFKDKYIAGDLLGHAVQWHAVEPFGSTVRTIHGGEVLKSNDTWFAPTDLTLGPDGAVYVSDWHDRRTAHPDPDADWDRTNGRIYRIVSKRPPSLPVAPIDFSQKSTEQLLQLHRHPSQWHVRHARQELVRRATNRTLGDESAIRAEFFSVAKNSQEQNAALEGLWSLNALDGISESRAILLLDSIHPIVRAWTVRLIGDHGPISADFAQQLDQLAERETVDEVRQQLACTAALLPANQAMPIINANIHRDIDNDDPRIPLLWWWAVERHSLTGRDEVLSRFLRPSFWNSRLGTETLLPRLIRRYAAENTTDGFDSVMKLVQQAPNDQAREALWQPILQGLQQHQVHIETEPIGNLQSLSQFVLLSWRKTPEYISLLRLAIFLRLQEPLQVAMAKAFDSKAATADRAEMLNLLASCGEPSLMEKALPLLERDEPEVILIAAIRVLAHFDSPTVSAALIAKLRSSSSSILRTQLMDRIVGRKSYVRDWLSAVERGEINPTTAPIDQVRRIGLLESPDLDALVAKYWGRLQASTSEEKLAEVRRLNNDLRAAAGNQEEGQILFNKLCASCHILFGEGKRIGPDLTSANRLDRDFLLISLVDPHSVIRKEYVGVSIVTTDGRVLNGLPTSRDESEITLVNSKNESERVSRSEIAEIKDSQVSIMPSDLYRQLSPQQLRDLFSYLQRNN